MGLTYVIATVESLGRTALPRQVRFLVDTGADCLLPASWLTEVGITPDEADVYELANGAAIRLPFGWARFSFMDTFVIAKAVFGPEDSEPLLGAIALESAGIIVDPLNQTLKRQVARSLKRAA